MIFIGICGASGSGKTTFAELLKEKLGDRAYVLAQDKYYLDHSHMDFAERAKVDYDDPDAFEHDLVYEDIEKLLHGESITEKNYNYKFHIRSDTGKLIPPCEVLLFEGIHVFHDERLMQLMDLKIFMDTDADVCLSRRIIRDMRERMRTVDSILEQYAATVKPAYDKYIKGYKRFADIVLEENSRTEKVADMVVNYIDKETKNVSGR